MAFPFGKAPTLGEFIDKARTHGVELKQCPVVEGPRGPVRFSYLWIDADRFVDLPDMGNGERLAPDIVDYLARRLKIATSEFWPGFDGFDDND